MDTPSDIFLGLVLYLAFVLSVVLKFGRPVTSFKDLLFRIGYAFLFLATFNVIMGLLHAFGIFIKPFPSCGPGNNPSAATGLVVRGMSFGLFCVSRRAWRPNAVMFSVAFAITCWACSWFSHPYHEILFEHSKKGAGHYTGNVCFLLCDECAMDKPEAFREWHTWLTGLYGVRNIEGIPNDELARLREQRPAVHCEWESPTKPTRSKQPK